MSSASRVPERSPMPYLPGALSQLIRTRIAKAAEDGPDVLLVRGNPRWDLQPHPRVGDRRVELRAAPSPLAVWELLAEHADLEGDEFLVIVTDAEDRELGTGVLGQVVGNKVYPVQPWEAVKEAFGAQGIDPRLREETWAAEALLDTSPNVRTVAFGQVLSRDTAMKHLASRRLSTPGAVIEPDDLDMRALLSWTRQPGALERFAALRAVEREPLAAWLADTAGPAARALFALVAAGRGSDAVPLGLVCSVLWTDAAAGAPVERARGRTELHFTNDPSAVPSLGGEPLSDRDFGAFGAAAHDFVAALPGSQRAALLHRAEQLVTQTGAEDAAAASVLLPSGLKARYQHVAQTLDAAVPSRRRPAAPSAEAVATLRHAVETLAEHRLINEDEADLDRVRMALRLVRWLAEPELEASSVAEAVQRQVNDGGWVDRAIHRISGGTERSTPELGNAFAKLAAQVRTRRKARDERFAAMLASWTSAGSSPGSLLTVETFVSQVLGPLKKAEPGFLFILIDGMSAAVAADLGEELRREGLWTEYDPVAGSAAVGSRRGMAAALPTLTKISRTSLFAADLVEGTQDTERQRFPTLPAWGGRQTQLFHKADLRAAIGTGLGAELQQAMDSPGTQIAVVLNTVDDLLDDTRAHADPWRLRDIDKLRTLLDQAASTGRPVIIAADHGHMLDIGTSMAPAAIAGSARHRLDTAPAGPGEVELTGPRVVAPGGRIVALWDTDLRYGTLKTGYHGGASLAEFSIPILALVPPGVTAPKGWAPVARTEPAWSNLLIDGVSAAVTPTDVPVARAKNVSEHQESLLDLEVPATPASLINQLLATELFKQRRASLPRAIPASRFEKALSALLDANGVLPAVAVAAAAGELPSRANGFATNLRRVLNIDGEPVLSVLDQGATLKLDLDKLRIQFELGR